MNGNLVQRKLSGRSRESILPVALEALIILTGGAFAMFLHHKLRIPLNIPGHHGLEFMAIFVLIRLGSGIRYAATLATAGVGLVLLIPGFGTGSTLNGIGYLLPGLVLDLLYVGSRKHLHNLFLITIAAGLAYMSIPLSRLAMNLIFAWPYGAFVKYGVGYTMISFLFFGMMGGMLAFGLQSIRKSIHNHNHSENENE